MGWEEGVGYPDHWMGDVVGYPAHHPAPPPPQDMGLGYPNLPPQTRPGYVTPSSASGHGTWIPYPLLTPLLTSGGHHWGPIHLRTYPSPPPHYQPVADLRGARETRPFPGGPNSFNIMQFLGKFGKILCWRPPRELANPPRGNPGSATANSTNTDAS